MKPPSYNIGPPSLVARIALVSEDRARQIEAILLRMAQTGQLRGRVTEEQLIDLLEKVRAYVSTKLLLVDWDAQGRRGFFEEQTQAGLYRREYTLR